MRAWRYNIGLVVVWMWVAAFGYGQYSQTGFRYGSWTDPFGEQWPTRGAEWTQYQNTSGGKLTVHTFTQTNQMTGYFGDTLYDIPPDEYFWIPTYRFDTGGIFYSEETWISEVTVSARDKRETGWRRVMDRTEQITEWSERRYEPTRWNDKEMHGTAWGDKQFGETVWDDRNYGDTMWDDWAYSEQWGDWRSATARSYTQFSAWSPDAASFSASTSVAQTRIAYYTDTTTHSRDGVRLGTRAGRKPWTRTGSVAWTRNGTADWSRTGTTHWTREGTLYDVVYGRDEEYFTDTGEATGNTVPFTDTQSTPVSDSGDDAASENGTDAVSEAGSDARFDNGEEPVSDSSSMAIADSNSTTEEGSETQTQTVSGTAQPVSGAITATGAVYPGGVVLSWSAANATAVHVAGPSCDTSTTGGSTTVGGLNVGTYTYTLTAEGVDGPITRTATATITPKPVDFTVPNLAPTYDGASHPAAVSSSDGGATYSVTYSAPGYGPTNTPPVNAGAYTVTVTANGNFSGSGTGTVTIAKATPVVTWNPSSPIVYGVAIGAAQLNASANVPGTFSYAASLGTVLPAGVRTLGATFTPTAANNYQSVDVAAQVTVNKATLTIRATDQTRVFGAANPTLGVSYVGFVNGDGVGTISSPAAATTANVTSSVGAYPITLTGGSAANYVLLLVDGTLTVTSKAVTFTFSNLSHVYDAGMKTAQVSVSDPAATFTADLSKGPHAGTYQVTATATGNYIGSGSANLTIAPAAQVVSITPAATTIPAGTTATFAASGGSNSYTWGGSAAPVSQGAIATAAPTTPGSYVVTVFAPGSGDFLPSNTATALVTVVGNQAVTEFVPVANSVTVSDPASPMNGRTYSRIWQEGSNWSAYLARSGVKFRVAGYAYPAVRSVEIQSYAPGAGTWTTLVRHDPAGVSSQVDVTVDTMLDTPSPGNPLMPVSYANGTSLTGVWRFRARLQDTTGEWSAFSNEVEVSAVLPIATKTVRGQTVPPAGAAGAWFTASPVKDFSIQFWIP